MSNSNGADFTSKISADPTGFESGVNRAIKSVTSLHTEIEKQFKSIGNITANVTGAFAKLAAVFAGGGVLKHFIEDTNAWNSSAGLMAKQLGISTERASVLSVALKHIGVEGETYTSAAEKLSKQIQGNAQAFDVLGVKVRDASGAYRPVTELMGEVNQKLADIKNPIEQNIAGQ